MDSGEVTPLISYRSTGLYRKIAIDPDVPAGVNRTLAFRAPFRSSATPNLGPIAGTLIEMRF